MYNMLSAGKAAYRHVKERLFKLYGKDGTRLGAYSTLLMGELSCANPGFNQKS